MTFGERRTYGGRIELLNLIRSPLSQFTRLSLTLGARTSIALAPHTSLRGRACPLRTTNARPCLSRGPDRFDVGFDLGLEGLREHLAGSPS